MQQNRREETNTLKIVACVPMKLNSERIKNKNIIPLGGKPLCSYIFNTLLDVKELDEIYAFCSDESIKQFLPRGVTYLSRETELDGSLVKANALYSSFIEKIDADIYLIAHTTAPFIKAETISGALKKIVSEGYDSAFAAQKIQTFAWYEGTPINYELNDIPRTQDLVPIFVETSGFFAFRKSVFIKYNQRIGFKPFVQEVDNYEAVDIDTQDDYDFAQMLAERGTFNEK